MVVGFGRLRTRSRLQSKVQPAVWGHPGNLNGLTNAAGVGPTEPARSAATSSRGGGIVVDWFASCYVGGPERSNRTLFGRVCGFPVWSSGGLLCTNPGAAGLRGFRSVWSWAMMRLAPTFLICSQLVLFIAPITSSMLPCCLQ